MENNHHREPAVAAVGLLVAVVRAPAGSEMVAAAGMARGLVAALVADSGAA